MVSDASLIETVEALRRHSVGAGPLDALLREPGVTDVLVNGPDQVYVDRGAGLELTGLRFADDGEVRRLAQRLAASVGRRLDDAVPFVDARLADGTRVHAVLGPSLADPGTCISLRVPRPRSFSLDDCVRVGVAAPRRGASCCAGSCSPAGLPGQRRDGLGQDHPARPPCSRWSRTEERIVIVEDSRELAPGPPARRPAGGRVRPTPSARARSP